MAKYEWDENKNQSNQDKHDLSFEDAKEIFADKDRIQYISSTKRYGERRYKTVGRLLRIIVTVVYTVRSSVLRIISARQASKKEKTDYIENESKKNKEDE